MLTSSTLRELQQDQRSDALSRRNSILSSVVEDGANTTTSILEGSGGSGAVVLTSSSASGGSSEGGSFATARTSGGSVTSTSAAFSTATAEEDFRVAVAKAVTEVESGDGDAIALAEVAAEVFALAIAEAYAETSVRIMSIFNDTRFCGSSFAEAGTSATASARILVNVCPTFSLFLTLTSVVAQVLAQASDKISFVDSEGAIEAIHDVTVSSFASAKTTACVNGVGQAEATSSQLSRAIGVAFAEVSALALAVVTPEADETEIMVEVDADDLVVTTVDGFTATKVVGLGKHQISLYTIYMTCRNAQLGPMLVQQEAPVRKDARYLENDTLDNSSQHPGSTFSVLRIRTVSDYSLMMLLPLDGWISEAGGCINLSEFERLSFSLFIMGA